MNRREFLQLSGMVGATSALGGPAEARTVDEAQWPGIDGSRVANRNQNRSTVVASGGMVCTSQPLATMAGVQMLKAGGNAIDAAICANAMLSLVEPMMCGPGGDLFAIVWSEKDQRLFGLNASGRAPYAWNIDEAKKHGLDHIPGESPFAWSVPGCVSGWEALSKRFGAKPFSEIFAPVIGYATGGFPVSPLIATAWPFSASASPSLAEAFLADGKIPGFGDIFKSPQLAEFYGILARDGVRAYYEGEIADRIVAFSKDQGGYFAKKDFEDHEATWVDPVSTNYRGFDVWELPPNGQGIAALQILNLLEHFDIASLKPNSVEQLHLFLEAKKLAFEDRAVYYADPAFETVPVKELISKSYAAERVKAIDPKRASTSLAPGMPEGHSDTIYMTAADSEGNMVSLIQSVYGRWGSFYVPGKLGFPLQNRGSSFALDPKHVNALKPHKRPFHTIIPAFVTRDEKPVFSFGVMGGSFQPQGHSQVLMNLIDYGMSPQQAGEQPRVGHSGSSQPDGSKIKEGGRVSLERHIPDDVRAGLEALGHEVRPGVDEHGGYQGIWRKEGPRRYFGGSDPRKDGMAAGY